MLGDLCISNLSQPESFTHSAFLVSILVGLLSHFLLFLLSLLYINKPLPHVLGECCIPNFSQPSRIVIPIFALPEETHCHCCRVDSALHMCHGGYCAHFPMPIAIVVEQTVPYICVMVDIALIFLCPLPLLQSRQCLTYVSWWTLRSFSYAHCHCCRVDSALHMCHGGHCAHFPMSIAIVVEQTVPYICVMVNIVLIFLSHCHCCRVDSALHMCHGGYCAHFPIAIVVEQTVPYICVMVDIVLIFLCPLPLLQSRQCLTYVSWWTLRSFSYAHCHCCRVDSALHMFSWWILRSFSYAHCHCCRVDSALHMCHGGHCAHFRMPIAIVVEQTVPYICVMVDIALIFLCPLPLLQSRQCLTYVSWWTLCSFSYAHCHCCRVDSALHMCHGGYCAHFPMPIAIVVEQTVPYICVTVDIALIFLCPLPLLQSRQCLTYVSWWILRSFSYAHCHCCRVDSALHMCHGGHCAHFPMPIAIVVEQTVPYICVTVDIALIFLCPLPLLQSRQCLTYVSWWSLRSFSYAHCHCCRVDSALHMCHGGYCTHFPMPIAIVVEQTVPYICVMVDIALIFLCPLPLLQSRQCLKYVSWWTLRSFSYAHCHCCRVDSALYMCHGGYCTHFPMPIAIVVEQTVPYICVTVDIALIFLCPLPLLQSRQCLTFVSWWTLHSFSYAHCHCCRVDSALHMCHGGYCAHFPMPIAIVVEQTVPYICVTVDIALIFLCPLPLLQSRQCLTYVSWWTLRSFSYAHCHCCRVDSALHICHGGYCAHFPMPIAIVVVDSALHMCHGGYCAHFPMPIAIVVEQTVPYICVMVDIALIFLCPLLLLQSRQCLTYVSWWILRSFSYAHCHCCRVDSALHMCHGGYCTHFPMPIAIVVEQTVPYICVMVDIALIFLCPLPLLQSRQCLTYVSWWTLHSFSYAHCHCCRVDSALHMCHGGYCAHFPMPIAIVVEQTVPYICVTVDIALIFLCPLPLLQSRQCLTYVSWWTLRSFSYAHCHCCRVDSALHICHGGYCAHFPMPIAIVVVDSALHMCHGGYCAHFPMPIAIVVEQTVPYICVMVDIALIFLCSLPLLQSRQCLTYVLMVDIALISLCPLPLLQSRQCLTYVSRWILHSFSYAHCHCCRVDSALHMCHGGHCTHFPMLIAIVIEQTVPYICVMVDIVLIFLCLLSLQLGLQAPLSVFGK